MKITSIILDGFKSFRDRTVIKEMDLIFTAVTGLNGSGKSNILDGIIFVLGLGSYSALRANSLRELIYKSGNAGITSASVTVVFDNKNKSTSPEGYKDFDQITITRMIKDDKSKYYINGRIVTATQVKFQFKSIGIDIENYFRFFVQQGSITKIVSFQSKEIYKLIEQTAGISHYIKEEGDLKKDTTRRNRDIECYDDALKDIEDKIQRNKDKKQNYEDYLEVKQDLDSKQKFSKAFKYYTYKNNMRDCDHYLLEKEQEYVDLDLKIKGLNSELEEYIKEININLELKNGLMKENFEETQSEINEANEMFEDFQRKLERSENDLSEIEQKVQELQGKYSRKDHLIEHNNSQFKFLNDEIRNCIERKKNIENKYWALKHQNPENTNYVENSLKQLKSHENDLLHEIKLSELKYKDLYSQQQQNEEQMSTFFGSKNKRNEKLQSTLLRIDDINILLNNLEKSMDSQHEFSFDSQFGESKLISQKKQIESDLYRLYSAVPEHQQRIEQRFGLSNRDFRDPQEGSELWEQGWSRSFVLGKIIQLFNVRDSKFTRCISKLGESKNSLHSLVVKNSWGCEMLIKHKLLPQRTCLIPLDCRSMVIDQHKRSLAHKMALKEGSGNVWWAIDVIEFLPEMKNALQNVFGQFLICDDDKLASKICFHPDIKCKVVTLEGNIYDPRGTVSGGCLPNATYNSLIEAYELYKERQNKSDKMRKEINIIENKIQNEQEKKTILNEKKLEKETLKSEKKKLASYIDDLKNDFRNNYLSNLQNKKEFMSDLLQRSEKDLSHRKSDLAKVQSQLENLQNKQKSNSEIISEKNKHLSYLKECIDTLDQDLESIKNEKNLVSAEKETIQDDFNKLQFEIDKKLNQRNVLNNFIASASMNIENTKSRIEILEADKKKLEEEMTSQEKVDVDKQQFRDNLKNEVFENVEKFEQVKKEKQNLFESYTNYASKFNDISSTEPWIQEEEIYFNVPSSEYQFENVDFDQTLQEIFDLESKIDVMRRNVDLNILEKSNFLEKKFGECNEKRKIVDEGFEMLNMNVDFLKDKKLDQFNKCFEKVNDYFGKIFSQLLKGANTKIELTKNTKNINRNGSLQNYIDYGCEIKVSFNGVWKDSLSELSGGQKSILALSLIMATLKYSPAPFYILDEVDAALDQSHTENLGKIISETFPESQFIAVSLKEQLYGSANVLFKTLTVEGRSKVSRVRLNKRKGIAAEADADDRIQNELDIQNKFNTPVKKILNW